MGTGTPFVGESIQSPAFRSPACRGATPRARVVAEIFGLAPRRTPRPPAAAPLRAAPGEILLITGPSGSGKSTLLRATAERVPAGLFPGVTWLERLAVPESQLVIDGFGGVPLPAALACLGRAGLAEARLWLAPAGALSEGQKFRYRLARWYAGGGGLLLADEFAAGLDRVTARGVAWGLRRFVAASRRSGAACAAVLATSQEDLGADLGAREVRLKG